MLGMLLAALDQTIVSTALPTIVGDLKVFGLASVVGPAWAAPPTRGGRRHLHPPATAPRHRRERPERRERQPR